MKTRFAIVLTATIVSGTLGVAQADLTINGAVGLPLNPTAETTGPLSVQAQANYFDLGDGADSAKLYGVYGAGRLLNRLEISGGLEKMSADRSSDDRSGIALGAKYSLMSLPGTGVNVAVGAGYSSALYRNTHAYIVASKAFSGIGDAAITGHVGARFDRFKWSGRTSNRASLYGGVEVPLTFAGTSDLALIGELQTKNADYSQSRTPYSLSLRYRPEGRPFSARVGWQRQGVTGDSGLFAQANIGF